jgi:hypothetical protein
MGSSYYCSNANEKNEITLFFEGMNITKLSTKLLFSMLNDYFLDIYDQKYWKYLVNQILISIYKKKDSINFWIKIYSSSNNNLYYLYLSLFFLCEKESDGEENTYFFKYVKLLNASNLVKEVKINDKDMLFLCPFETKRFLIVYFSLISINCIEYALNDPSESKELNLQEYKTAMKELFQEICIHQVASDFIDQRPLISFSHFYQDIYPKLLNHQLIREKILQQYQNSILKIVNTKKRDEKQKKNELELRKRVLEETV